MNRLREAARRLEVHENTLRNWVKRGVVRAIRPPGARYQRFDPDEIDRAAAAERRRRELEVATRRRKVALATIRVLRLEPGDVLVLQVREALTKERADDAEAVLRHEFPGHQVLVLHGGRELSVVRSWPEPAGQHPGEISTQFV